MGIRANETKDADGAATLPQVLLSGFCDEASSTKDFREQLAVSAALGLDYVSLRFLNLGNGVEHVTALAPGGIAIVRDHLREYGMKVCSVGSPLGKVKLVDVEDGSGNRFVPFSQYLANDVPRVCDLASLLETRLIRGFSFYPPRGVDPVPFLPQAIDQIGRIADACQARGLLYGLEVEANLVGRSGQTLARIHKELNHPALTLVFDGGNLACQGYDPAAVLDEYRVMKDGLGWIHVKDFRQPQEQPLAIGGHVDEAALTDFVPVGQGDAGYDLVLRDLRDELPTFVDRLTKQGVPGFFLELEPHVRGGGQFGGFSGPDGFGIATRALCALLTRLKIPFSLRDSGALRS